ncbi:DUF1735 domain-containing protein [Mucilaginibacter sp. HC2]|uniref:DUF1735 domain-containing protein n=1 Tax=Mucilaginibacter inviolabilis TaxID=2714892 RepID=UPI00140E775E|nr:DUF1735 domain-containing protein [Mucilaginibacter inviolabilis]NHA05073.1 DUF1735 domain-containing protein [Mucilaginibacter inviolabilis]
MKIHVSSMLKWAACLVLTIASCKQEYLEGVKSNPAVKVYLPQAEKPNGLVNALVDGKLTVDSVAGTANFSVPVYRGGESNFDALTVDVGIDNTAIAGLITSGALPANTVILDPADYILPSKDSVALNNHIMQGVIIPKVKISSMAKYGGKTAALGIKIANSSKQAINTDMNKVIIYFDVDQLLDAVTPKTNMVDKTKWTVLKIASNDNVTFKVNDDGSILASGGNGGHQGVYQSFEVRANKQYKIDFNVQGQGATNTWFEVYLSTLQPTQNKDYSDGGIRMALNTWTGCGNAPFNGLLSVVKCVGSGNVVSFPNAGTVWLVIKSGGDNLGTGGIKLTNIDFRRVN